MEKDLVRFHIGTDFLFLFHLGKRKENIGSANKTYFNSKIVDVCKFESSFAMPFWYDTGVLLQNHRNGRRMGVGKKSA